jgi:hypothetical protein
MPVHSLKGIVLPAGRVVEKRSVEVGLLERASGAAGAKIAHQTEACSHGFSVDIRVWHERGRRPRYGLVVVGPGPAARCQA